MYTLKMSYGDVDDEPEMATAEILGTYESLDEACEAAEREFDDIMELLDDDEAHIYDIERGCGDHYVSYGHCDCEIGRVLNAHYYSVYVVETMR